MPLKRKSSPRLQDFGYRGFDAYMITMNTYQTRRTFLNANLTNTCIDDLIRSAEEEAFEVLAYCFMPDHVHLLVQGVDEGSDLGPFMKRFKQMTGYRYKQRTGQQLWHRSYHDHIVRDEEVLVDISDYIWHNPVRAGLVRERTEYPFSGPSYRFADGPSGLSVQERLAETGETDHASGEMA